MVIGLWTLCIIFEALVRPLSALEYQRNNISSFEPHELGEAVSILG